MPRSSLLAPALLALALAWPAPGAPPGSRLAAATGPAPAAPAAPAAQAAPGASLPPAASWSALAPGLDLGLFPGPGGAPGDGLIWVVRVDPARFDLRLLNASASDARPHTVRDWVVGAGASAGINAAMFQTDGLTSIGLMRTRGHQNNPRRSARLKAVLAFDPLDRGLPPVRILDTGCGEAEGGLAGYGTLIQSIRMISCERLNVWAAEGRRASTAAIGVDGSGRALLVHARSPWSVHDLVDALLALPIDLQRALYVEGGPEAQLFARGGGREVERLGAFEGGAEGSGGLAWELPNVVVAVRRAR